MSLGFGKKREEKRREEWSRDGRRGEEWSGVEGKKTVYFSAWQLVIRQYHSAETADSPQTE